MTILREHCLLQVIWCDDIRQEVGNKPSFMGVYSELALPSVPIVLPRLAAYVTLYTPITTPLADLALRIMKSDEEKPLAYIEMSAQEQIEPPARSADDPSTVRLLSFGILIGNVAFDEGTKWLRADADYGNEHLESLKLRISSPERPLEQRAEKAAT